MRRFRRLPAFKYGCDLLLLRQIRVVGFLRLRAVAHSTFGFVHAGHIFVDGGPVEHLTTLFPPVRPRHGYLEVRFPDARPADQVLPLVAGLAGLLYDDQRRRAALESLRGVQPRLRELWEDAAAGRLDPARGTALLGGRVAEVAA